MPNYLKRYSYFFKFLFWLALATLSVLLLIELKPDQSGWPYKDKLQHIFSFFVLTQLGLLAYFNRQKQLYIGVACYGLLMEILQGAFTLTRQASLYDWLADCAGIGLGLAVMALLTAYFQTINKAKADA